MIVTCIRTRSLHFFGAIFFRLLYPCQMMWIFSAQYFFTKFLALNFTGSVCEGVELLVAFRTVYIC